MGVNYRSTVFRIALTLQQQGISLYKTALNYVKLWKQVQRKLCCVMDFVRDSIKFCGD